MRTINELIWHCTATPEGREHTAADIDRWHRANGWAGIGYHKVVHLDGSVSEGRREAQAGAHVAGRNAATLGYVYVGGVTAAMQPKDTRTAAQKATMLRLTKEAAARYALKMVSGHHDYAAKACPCFPARQEYAHLLAGGATLPSPGAGAGASAPAIGAGTVTASSLNLHRSPNGDIIGSMPRGTVLAINGADGDWLSVTTPFPATGWAHRDHIATDIAPPHPDIAAPETDDPQAQAVALIEQALVILRA